MTVSWTKVTQELRRIVRDTGLPLDDGQRDSLHWMAERLPHGGLVLADEVGIGKTRIACAVVAAVRKAGGRAAVVVPQGLMHQWQVEAASLGALLPTPQTVSTYRGLLEAVDDSQWIRPGDGDWCLVSHGFRAPSVRATSPAWRAALPGLVHLELEPRGAREDGRTRAGRLTRELDDKDRRWLRSLRHMAGALAPLVRGQRDLRRRLEALPPLQVSGEVGAHAAWARGGDGRLLTEKMLGLWLGPFDLVVIDEAHKGRADLDADPEAPASRATVLARLIDHLLQQPDDGRRLCLTATPMELAMGQWLDLLARARAGHDVGQARAAVDRLHDAASRAAMAPDEISRLDELCAAARGFNRSLSPWVTRRRRDEDALVMRFGTAVASTHPSHPHRRRRAISIGWGDVDDERSPWLDVLFAAECMAEAARGLAQEHTEAWPRAIRDAATRLSAGHVSIDLVETGDPLRVPEPGAVDDRTRAKIARVAYWYRRVRDARRRVLSAFPSIPNVHFDPDTEHPRLLAAVKEIEHWTATKEKVLVFGVFLQPLRHLRDVLNVRDALRRADAGLLLSHKLHDDDAQRGIAIRQLERLRREGALHGALATASVEEMWRVLKRSHAAYTRVRAQVAERARMWRRDPTTLAAIEPRLHDAFIHQVVTFVIDEVLADDHVAAVDQDRFDALAHTFRTERLRAIVGDDVDDDDHDRVDARQRALELWLGDDDSQQSRHARLLEGSTGWGTRKALQAAFNRSRAAPQVLIAQSQVGREGLNLHEACRVVVQFHAEWNPGVLEQQVGRVDRKGSLWEKQARAWLDAPVGEPPFIEVRQLIFEGTYDAHQWDRVMRRQHVFDASLFGALLPEQAWERVPRERVDEVRAAAPSFRPPRLATRA
jgi:hypothetical protein